ncbi:MAG: 6-phosphogluconolactonase [Bradymonadales bacterium]|nr:6-phosphogluconolactonase [Bradymonadales bacterium]
MAIQVFPSPIELARAAAREILRQARQAIQQGGRFAVALSGGSTPRLLFAELARSGQSDRDVWDRTHLFWGDERMVPPDHPDSNYYWANKLLLTEIGISPDQIHPIPTAGGTPDELARIYESHLRRFFDPPQGDFPRLDLILLGVGPDGHTASLFPGSEALGERVRWVTACRVEANKTHRITLTLPVLGRAGRVLFLVAGADKAPIVARILGPRDREEPPLLPAQMVGAIARAQDWFLDEQAAQGGSK